MIQRIIDSTRFRLKRRSFGLSEGSETADGLKVKVAGRPVTLRFPDSERDAFIHEFGLIFIDDCYGLEQRGDGVRTVLDIGANLGLFSLAARHHFREATVHSYEPNAEIERYLAANLEGFGVERRMAAVGLEQGFVRLDRGESSLMTVARRDDAGNVAQVSFREAVAQLGGTVDVLKLDCEGAEWAIFEDAESWRAVKFVTMEYHLWAKPGATLVDLDKVLDGLGFTTLHREHAPEGTFGLLQAVRKG